MESESRIARLEPGLRRVLAPNPSPMTLHGTNTYIVGRARPCIIDPGPDAPEHLDRLMRELDSAEQVTAILVTHSHLDHSPLAARLSERTGAPVLAAGPSDWGRSPAMEALARGNQVGGGEGVDKDFIPHRRIEPDDTIETDRGHIGVLATPGHMANHLSFTWAGALFSGDIVMGWSTSLISPPDGDLTAFMASVEMLRTRRDRIFYPGHGAPVADPQSRCAELLDHRRARDRQIRAALSEMGTATARALAERIYTEVAPALLPVAERNVLAHLLDLMERNLASPDGPPGPDTGFSLC